MAAAAGQAGCDRRGPLVRGSVFLPALRHSAFLEAHGTCQALCWALSHAWIYSLRLRALLSGDYCVPFTDWIPEARPAADTGRLNSEPLPQGL